MSVYFHFNFYDANIVPKTERSHNHHLFLLQFNIFQIPLNYSLKLGEVLVKKS